MPARNREKILRRLRMTYHLIGEALNHVDTVEENKTVQKAKEMILEKMKGE